MSAPAQKDGDLGMAALGAAAVDPAQARPGAGEVTLDDIDATPAVDPRDAATLAGVPRPEAQAGPDVAPDDRATRQEAAAAPVDAGGITLDDVDRATRKGAHTTRNEADDAALDEKIRASLADGPRKKDALLGTTVGGRFQVLKKIGAGGMGAVYRARQEGMDRDVAVKVLLGDLAENETVLRRFTLEALAVSRLRHPHTIQIFDYGQTPQGNPYIAMEFLEGQTLHDLLRSERPLPIRRALRILTAVAQSLDEAHGKGIVHRDLKPENIFLTRVGSDPDYVKVLDFGVAKLRDNDLDGKGTLTQAGSIFGTPRYMSPEQCSAQPVDGRSDLYSLGVILYEMITGQAPFVSDQPLTLLLAHVNDPPPPPNTMTDKQVIPAEVEELVLQLLAKGPDERIQQASELAQRCAEAAEHLPAAFDERVGVAQAESLGVRLPSVHTLELPTARTLKLGPGAAAPPPQLLEAPSSGRRYVLPLAALGAVGIGALVVALVGRQPETVVVEKPVVVERIVHATVPDGQVEVGIQSTPPGAYILLNGQKIGETGSERIRRPKGAPPETWQLVRDGCEPRTLQVKFEQSQQIDVVLTRTAPTLPAAPVPVVESGREPAREPRPQPVVGKPRPRTEAKPEPARTPEPAQPKAATTEPKAEPKAEPPKPAKKKDDGLVEEIM